MDELLSPIQGVGLDEKTLFRLYESKLVYLKNLRVKCFQDMNRRSPVNLFTEPDYKRILKAIDQTEVHLHDLVVKAVLSRLE